MVGPWQLYGIEINSYAFDLAQTTLWIGWLQWVRANGFGVVNDPILRPLTGFQCMDAVLDLSDPASPREPEWPEVDFIIGNPPFLGGKKIRSELGDKYVDALFGLWRERVRPEADLCCYWFEKARRLIEEGRCKRSGLLATQGIRCGANRDTVKRIKKSGDIFFDESDRDWILDGAAVHVSMIGFDDGTETERTLDRRSVGQIHSDLTAGVDVTQANQCNERARAGRLTIRTMLTHGFLLQENRPNADLIVRGVSTRQYLPCSERGGQVLFVEALGRAFLSGSSTSLRFFWYNA